MVKHRVLAANHKLGTVEATDYASQDEAYRAIAETERELQRQGFVMTDVTQFLAGESVNAGFEAYTSADSDEPTISVEYRKIS